MNKLNENARPTHRRLSCSGRFVGSVTYIWDGGDRTYDLYCEGDTLAFRRNKAGIPEKISLALASRWRGGNTVWGVGADIVRKTANRAAPAAYQVASTRRPDWFSN